MGGGDFPACPLEIENQKEVKMISKKQARALAQQAWETGTYLDGNGNHYIILPSEGCLVIWSTNKKGEICKVQVEQAAYGI